MSKLNFIEIRKFFITPSNNFKVFIGVLYRPSDCAFQYFRILLFCALDFFNVF